MARILSCLLINAVASRACRELGKDVLDGDKHGDVVIDGDGRDGLAIGVAQEDGGRLDQAVVFRLVQVGDDIAHLLGALAEDRKQFGCGRPADHTLGDVAVLDGDDGGEGGVDILEVVHRDLAVLSELRCYAFCETLTKI